MSDINLIIPSDSSVVDLSIPTSTNVVNTIVESQNSISIDPTSSVTPTSLLGLTDVNASSITNGQILSYDSSSGTFTPSSDSNSNTTYSVSCVDGDNSDEEKIRLTDSDGGTDDVVLEAGTGLSIARSSDKITLTNTVTDTNTQLSTEAVQDIVGLMFTSNTETRIAATYEDGDGTIDLVVDDMTADTQLTTEAVQDIVGGMFSSNTETGITATYQDGDGTIDLVVTGGRVFDVSNSFRATASVENDWYYGHTNYGWNYVLWSARRSDFDEVYFSYCNSGIVVPAAFTIATIRGVVKNSSVAGNDYTFSLYKTPNPNGAASAVAATLLVSQDITLTTKNVMYKIDATATSLTISEDDLLFFTVRRTSGGAATNNTDVSVTITLE